MPLESGRSREAIGHNIEEMEKAGHPHKQAVAAALHKAYDGATAAGVLLRSPQGRVLFLKRGDGARDHPGTWCFPGGGIEDSETPEQAARRETQEETGYAGNDPLVEIDGGDFVTFSAQVEEYEPRLNDEHTESVWAPMDAPPEPLHPGVAATLKKLVAEDARGEALDRREYDANGWFEVPDNPLSKVGVFPYSEATVVKGGDRKKIVYVYRPAEELGSEECIKSFRLMPWTDDHPSTLLGPEEDGLVPAEKKGVHGVIGEQVYFSDDTLYGNIKVFSESLAKKIAKGKRELSCGYHCDFVPEEGVFKGRAYQYVQRKVRGNHFSSVGQGRMGRGVRVLDSAERLTFSLDMKEPVMAEKRADEAADSLDADTHKFIEDSFNSLVGELERKGYSKGYATKIAGKVAAEKGKTGHHDSTDKVTDMGTETKTEEELKKAKDRKAARDSARSARDSLRASDEMSSEQEEAEDAKECAEDAEEEKDDEKDESKEAKDRKSARDRRAGARDARKGARDRKSARDAKAARDAAAAAAAAGKGLDAAAVTALVKQEVTAATAGAMDESKVAAIVDKHTSGVRKDAANAQRLYQGLSPIVGAFDHDEMSTKDMAVYGLKKLGQTQAADSADPVTALECYLTARGERQADPAKRSAQDSGSKDGFVGKYLAA